MAPTKPAPGRRRKGVRPRVVPLLVFAPVATQEQRGELATFLRARRERVVRAELGLPPRRGGREHGASREEIAVFAGMSGTWYSWLEQARPMNPSRQVLDSLARVFALSPAEHAYVLELAGFAPSPALEAAEPAAVPEHLERLLDGMPSFPAFAVAADWRIIGWNRAYARLYPNIESVDDDHRNLLWLVFTDPYVREMLPDWDTDSRHFVAEFRAEAGPRLADRAYVDLVQSLLAASREFAAVWKDHEIQRFTSRIRRFHHRDVGDLLLEHHRLMPADHPGVHLVVYTPAPDEPTRERLARLLRG